MKALCIVAGFLVALYGAWHVLLVYSFSTTIGLDLPDAARHDAQSRALADGASTIGFGVVLILAGIWLAVGKPKPRA